jgi:DNA-binding MarR family transcriptional regulator
MGMNVEAYIKTGSPLPPERRTIIHLVLVHNHLQDQLSQALKPFDISLQQFNVMRILRGQKGNPANLSTINERMVSRMSNTTRLVDKLIAKQYAERNTCPQNRRKVEIRLTPKGLEILKEMDRAVDAVEREVLKPLDEKQMKELNQLLDLIY